MVVDSLHGTLIEVVVVLKSELQESDQASALKKLKGEGKKLRVLSFNLFSLPHGSGKLAL